MDHGSPSGVTLFNQKGSEPKNFLRATSGGKEGPSPCPAPPRIPQASSADALLLDKSFTFPVPADRGDHGHVVFQAEGNGVQSFAQGSHREKWIIIKIPVIFQDLEEMLPAKTLCVCVCVCLEWERGLWNRQDNKENKEPRWLLDRFFN